MRVPGGAFDDDNDDSRGERPNDGNELEHRGDAAQQHGILAPAELQEGGVNDEAAARENHQSANVVSEQNVHVVEDLVEDDAVAAGGGPVDDGLADLRAILEEEEAQDGDQDELENASGLRGHRGERGFDERKRFLVEACHLRANALDNPAAQRVEDFRERDGG